MQIRDLNQFVFVKKIGVSIHQFTVVFLTSCSFSFKNKLKNVTVVYAECAKCNHVDSMHTTINTDYSTKITQKQLCTR